MLDHGNRSDAADRPAGGASNWRFLIPIGFIGRTDVSTFEYETFRAVADGAWLVGGLNVLPASSPAIRRCGLASSSVADLGREP
jgi:fluoride ion exporter CrcB/FEX